MRIADMNWMQVEARLKVDDRCILPIGCTEQHAYLSLAVDSILAERVSIEAAEPLGVPVFPVLPFGMTHGFLAYPGTISLRLASFAMVVEDLLKSVYRAGFRRILVVNGHGGNAPVGTVLAEWRERRGDAKVMHHDWWRGPKTWAQVTAIDPAASHASWMENFPWTRLPGVIQPQTRKPAVDDSTLRWADAKATRRIVGDGNYHGLYERADADMLAIWRVAVEETRALLEQGW
jgi:creatinine amidohydrolase